MDFIDKIINMKKGNQIKLENEIKKLSQKDLILFGAGGMSDYVVSSIRKLGLNPICFCDNNIKKVGKYISEIPIISFQELCNSHKNSNIYITSTFYYNDIRKQLLQNGFIDEDISSYDLVKIFPWETDYSDFIIKNKENFQNLFSILADEKSREVLIGRLNFLASRKREYMTSIRTQNQYFEDELIKLSNKEIFVDLGAYTGDTIKAFIDTCEGTYEKIYAFEPEEQAYNKLSLFCKSKKNIELVKAGVWNKDGFIAYNTICDDFAITLAEDGLNFDDKSDNHFMETRTVDSILNGQQATFIKMDTVGVEKEALEGCIKTIQTYKPTLAVCVYHKAADIITLPKYILELCPNYKIYLRHYSDGVSETVCYAIPY